MVILLSHKVDFGQVLLQRLNRSLIAVHGPSTHKEDVIVLMCMYLITEFEKHKAKIKI